MGATNHLLSDNLAKVLHSQEGLENEVTLNIGRNKSIRLHYLNDTIDEDHFCTNIDENNNILINAENYTVSLENNPAAILVGFEW